MTHSVDVISYSCTIINFTVLLEGSFWRQINEGHRQIRVAIKPHIPLHESLVVVNWRRIHEDRFYHRLDHPGVLPQSLEQSFSFDLRVPCGTVFSRWSVKEKRASVGLWQTWHYNAAILRRKTLAFEKEWFECCFCVEISITSSLWTGTMKGTLCFVILEK